MQMTYTHECLQGQELTELMDKLEEYSQGGWELVSSSFEPAAAYGKNGRHYLFIRRRAP
jgi:hypothetical protein